MKAAGGAQLFLFDADAWLGETLGKPVYKLAVAVDARAAAALEADMLRLAAGGPAFYYAKSPTRNVAASTTLTRAGFAIVDTAITFASTHQHQAVADIAGSAFRWSRFHLDPQVTAADANLIKLRWIENYLLCNRGSAPYIAEVSGETAGFLAVLEAQVDDRATAVINLIAVAPQFRGRGVGAALVDTFIACWRDRVEEQRVGTQAENIQSLRLYEQAGFCVAGTSYVLHAHASAGSIQR